MLEDFLSYIESNLSVIREDKILLSVSGGIDSMVMLHLFRQLGYKIEVAHINHSTRNGESDKDMAFVEQYCEEKLIPFHAKILEYADLQKGNFQENARNERFAFLHKTATDQNCKWIATAHHKDDRWETFLMHLNRKSGIQGLTSLRSKENQIIHPLLIFTKEQIVNYGKNNNISFVHDKSNDSDDYKRNAIRNRITPEIVNLFPDFIKNVNQSINHLDETYDLIQELIDRNQIVTEDIKEGYSIISLEKIKAFTNQTSLLYHIISRYGFNYSNVHDIIQTSATGTQFLSPQYEGLYDRGKLIIRQKKEFSNTDITIDKVGSYPLPNGKILLVEMSPDTQLASHLWIDTKKVIWPIKVRNIQQGDKFKPQGMNGATKTLKKLCSDLKINRFEKEDMLVVCKDDCILQVIGIRTSQEYITDDIKNAVTFSIVV